MRIWNLIPKDDHLYKITYFTIKYINFIKTPISYNVILRPKLISKEKEIDCFIIFSIILEIHFGFNQDVPHEK